MLKSRSLNQAENKDEDLNDRENPNNQDNIDNTDNINNIDNTDNINNLEDKNSATASASSPKTITSSDCITHLSKILEFLPTPGETPPTKNKLGSLFDLFQSEYFDMHLLLCYLDKKDEHGRDQRETKKGEHQLGAEA